MRQSKLTLVALLLIAFTLMSAAAFAGAKKYQVTGKIVELTDKVIVVQKGEEKWELDRTADTKIEGVLKVGEKVTIYYHMVADTGEVKKDEKPSK